MEKNRKRETEIIERLRKEQQIDLEDLCILLTTQDEACVNELSECARRVAQSIYGNQIYIRGLIEFTNYCKNDCLYCGIRRSNRNAERYRLSEEQILDCCGTGYELGFRTFVLQGGEDPYFTDERICALVRKIKEDYPDCAVTLSIGEKEHASYEAYFEAGADRYLLRHETADEAHYKKLHPAEMSLTNRKRCLFDLKEIGYQTGCGFMVGSPYQTMETLYEDLMFIKELQPQMVGIGPFIPQKDTPFGNQAAGTLDMTLRLLSIIRLLHPHVLLPATTALGTIHPKGREKGILAGANVVMPNLSPVGVRDKYKLYDNKICTGDEAAECRYCMQNRMESIGYQVVTDRGDYKI
ncbi:MAG: [FeFe] hydrogenase H-cluster radical SAM maturase HydE [Lachnospiraceae bacterium]|nr:[FeFe] hydrogenase H-cluster radical SAM maturase HydE [Lachnospiraceae bacterium]